MRLPRSRHRQDHGKTYLPGHPSASIELCGAGIGYQETPVVRDLDLHVNPGEVVALLGRNGAGKTTTLRGLTGRLPLQAGRLYWHGSSSVGPTHRRAREGMATVAEGRTVFVELTVRENLRVAGGDQQMALHVFPELRALLDRRAGLLSGGEQQMLTLGRALARGPRLLLADELSLGLAPLIVQRLLRAVRDVADKGVGVLLVEQHVRQVLKVADRVYVLRRGSVDFTGTAEEALNNLDLIERSYLSEDVRPEELNRT